MGWLDLVYRVLHVPSQDTCRTKTHDVFVAQQSLAHMVVAVQVGGDYRNPPYLPLRCLSRAVAGM